MKNFLITGAHGLLGSEVKKILSNQSVLIPFRSELDLLNREKTFEYFKINNIDYVFHLAADVGGIEYNQKNNAKLFRNNLEINNNLIDACEKFNITRCIGMSSTCVYPESLMNSGIQMQENQIFDGPPSESNKGYAYAKRMMMQYMQMLNEKHNRKRYVVAISQNLYGINDNFNLNVAHVIPSLIRKIYEAKISNAASLELFGTGNEIREFLHAKDAALQIKNLLFCPELKYHSYNLNNFVQQSIADIAKIICDEFNFSFESIIWNNSFKGVAQKRTSFERIENQFSSSKAYNSIGDNLRIVCNNFANCYKNERHQLRL